MHLVDFMPIFCKLYAYIYSISGLHATETQDHVQICLEADEQQTKTLHFFPICMIIELFQSKLLNQTPSNGIPDFQDWTSYM